MNKEMNKDKDIIQELKKIISCIECFCCGPITIYGLYLKYKNPSYKYEITLDQPTIEAVVDQYI